MLVGIIFMLLIIIIGLCLKTVFYYEDKFTTLYRLLYSEYYKQRDKEVPDDAMTCLTSIINQIKNTLEP